MKVLFLCKSNVGRSQIAEAFFDKYSSKNTGISAGTDATKYEGVPLSKISGNVVRCMTDVGLDVSKKNTHPTYKRISRKSR